MRNWTNNSLVRARSLARRRLASAVGLALAGLLLPVLPAYPQGRAEQRRGAHLERKAQARRSLRRAASRRAGFFERLRDLPPKEQERVLKNDKRFQRLSPERKQRIRENLKRWNQLSPERKAQIRRRERIYSQLSPEQRRSVRRMSRQWRGLPPAQRRKVRQALRRMRGMTPAERRKFLNSRQFEQRFSPEEQGILRGLGRLFPDDNVPDR